MRPPNYQVREDLNVRLMEWQKGPSAWDYSLGFLKENRRDVTLFGAVTIYQKVKSEFSRFNARNYHQIVLQLVECAVLAASRNQMAVVEKLSGSISIFALFSIPLWPTLFQDIFRLVNFDPQLVALVNVKLSDDIFRVPTSLIRKVSLESVPASPASQMIFLQVISKFPPNLIDLHATFDYRNKVSNFLGNHIGLVMKGLNATLQHSDTITSRHLFFCIKEWLLLESINISHVLESDILPSIIAGIKSDDDDIFEEACETFTACYTVKDLSRYHDVMNKLVKEINSLRHFCGVHKDDPDRMKHYSIIISEFAEEFSDSLTQISEQDRNEFLQLLLDLFRSQPHETAKLFGGAWGQVIMEFTERPEIDDFLTAYFSDLAKEHVAKCIFPSDPSRWSPDDLEEFLNFRADLRENIELLHNLLGDRLLHIVSDLTALVLHLNPQTQVVQAHEFDLAKVEAILYAFVSLSDVVDTGDQFGHFVINVLRQLPLSPHIFSSYYQAVNGFHRWIRTDQELHSILLYVFEGLKTREHSVQASKALVRITFNCKAAFTSDSDSFVSNLVDFLPSIQQVEAKKNVYESISHLSSIHPHTQYNLLLTVCKMIFTSLQRELQTHDPSHAALKIKQELANLSGVISSAGQQPHKLVEVIKEMWPSIISIANNFSLHITVHESIGLFVETSIKTAKDSIRPLFDDFLSFLTLSYSLVPTVESINAFKLLITEFHQNDLCAPALVQGILSFSQSTLTRLSSQSRYENPSILQNFFVLLQTVLQVEPRWMSMNLDIPKCAITIALQLIKHLNHKESVVEVLRFIAKTIDTKNPNDYTQHGIQHLGFYGSELCIALVHALSVSIVMRLTSNKVADLFLAMRNANDDAFFQWIIPPLVEKKVPADLITKLQNTIRFEAARGTTSSIKSFEILKEVTDSMEKTYAKVETSLHVGDQ